MDNMKVGKRKKIMKKVVNVIIKSLGLLLALYFFICSLTFLSYSFRILGGRNLSALFSKSELLSNPILGVIIGILVTVLVQSSATSTSIIVSLVSAGVDVRHAIPMIFGSNVGTSVTNTIVSLTQAGDKESFRRAFAAATVHDMFNWLAVIVLMMVELSTGFLYHLTGYLVEHMPLDSDVENPDLLKPLTKPFTEKIVMIDQEVLLGWSFENEKYDNISTLILTNCAKDNLTVVDCTHLAALLGKNGLHWSDTVIGLLLLAFSLALLCGCLLALMKILNSLLSDKMAALIQKTINTDIPYCSWLTGYLAMFIGAIITILVRSSSVFTSTLTPLCGSGLVTLETAYPLTLGSNIGTTTTSIIASLAAEGKYLKPSIQIALVHLFFNVIGIIIFYPIPWMRWPIPLAKMLGDITAEYRWFAVLYLIFMFFILPLFVFSLSFAGVVFMYIVMSAISLVLAVVISINLLQHYKPEVLPKQIQNWHFLPLWMRSLAPMDRVISRLVCCSNCVHKEKDCEESAAQPCPPDSTRLEDAYLVTNGNCGIEEAGETEALFKQNGHETNGLIPIYVPVSEIKS